MNKTTLLEEARTVGADVDPSWHKDRIAAAIVAARRGLSGQGSGGVPEILEARRRASELGIVVPDDWTVEQINTTIKGMSQEHYHPPWQGHSPRG